MIKSTFVFCVAFVSAPAWSAVTVCDPALSAVLDSTDIRRTPFTGDPRGSLVNLPRLEAHDPFGFFGEDLANDPSVVVTNFGGYKIYLGGKIFAEGLGEDDRDVRITTLDNSANGRRILTTVRVGPKIEVQLILNVNADATRVKVWMRARTPADELSTFREIATFGTAD